MPKSKHSPEFRAKVSQEYLDGIGSKLATTSSTQHHKLKEKMERNLFAGSFHCVKI